MSDLQNLASRLDAALRQLETARGSAGQNTSALVAENQALSQKLAAVQSEREKDLAQLDKLIAQLKPLVEEAV